MANDIVKKSHFEWNRDGGSCHFEAETRFITGGRVVIRILSAMLS